MDSSPTRLIDSDSAHAGMLPGQSPKSQPGAEHAPAAAASDPAADGGTANGAAAASDLARPSQWKNARGVLTAVRAAGRFATLRDLIGTDAYIEPGRLKLLKALGEGAFAHVQHAQLRPEGASEKDDSRLRDVAVKTLRQELLQDPDQARGGRAAPPGPRRQLAGGWDTLPPTHAPAGPQLADARFAAGRLAAACAHRAVPSSALHRTPNPARRSSCSSRRWRSCASCATSEPINGPVCVGLLGLCVLLGLYAFAWKTGWPCRCSNPGTKPQFAAPQ